MNTKFGRLPLLPKLKALLLHPVNNDKPAAAEVTAADVNSLLVNSLPFILKFP
jgi:hypothetical protein